jgi:hypothetical protein
MAQIIQMVLRGEWGKDLYTLSDCSVVVSGEADRSLKVFSDCRMVREKDGKIEYCREEDVMRGLIDDEIMYVFAQYLSGKITRSWAISWFKSLGISESEIDNWAGYFGVEWTVREFQYKPTKWANHFQPRCNPARIMKKYRLGMLTKYELQAALWDSCGLKYEEVAR